MNADFEDDPLPEKPKPYEGVRFLRKQSGAENLIEYGTLHGASVNDKWAPTDLDTQEADGSPVTYGVTERHGNFLIWELKQPEELISEGQRIMLEALAAEPNKAVYVFRLSGWRDFNGARIFDPIELMRVGKQTEFIPTSIEKVRSIYSKFFEWAEKYPCKSLIKQV